MHLPWANSLLAAYFLRWKRVKSSGMGLFGVAFTPTGFAQTAQRQQSPRNSCSHPTQSSRKGIPVSQIRSWTWCGTCSMSVTRTSSLLCNLATSCKGTAHLIHECLFHYKGTSIKSNARTVKSSLPQGHLPLYPHLGVHKVSHWDTFSFFGTSPLNEWTQFYKKDAHLTKPQQHYKAARYLLFLSSNSHKFRLSGARISQAFANRILALKLVQQDR